jgi:hypothetical protein
VSDRPDAKPGVRERLFEAFSADDISISQHQRTDADYLIALGLATAKPGCAATSLRLQAGDAAQLREARKATLVLAWRLNDKRNWRLSAANIQKVADAALLHHVHPTCPDCEGRRFEPIPGTPHLSATPCKRCGGTGIRPIQRKHNDFIRDVLERLRQIDAVTTGAVRKLLR